MASIVSFNEEESKKKWRVRWHFCGKRIVKYCYTREEAEAAEKEIQDKIDYIQKVECIPAQFKALVYPEARRHWLPEANSKCIRTLTPNRSKITT